MNQSVYEVNPLSGHVSKARKEQRAKELAERARAERVLTLKAELAKDADVTNEVFSDIKQAQKTSRKKKTSE